MAKLMTFTCDVCGVVHMENTEGDGAVGWGQLLGVNLNGIENPLLCPNDLTLVADFIDSMVEKRKE